jgi:hypothetical protein
MQSIRRNNLYCLTRYEKTFKPYSAEDFVLASAGGSYNNTKGEKMPWPLGWRGYVSAGEFPSTTIEKDGSKKGLDYARRGDIIQYQLSDGRWHLAYVEYADYTPDERGAMDTNPTWDFEKAQFSGMSKAPNNLYVVSWDQGRFPTATGATTYMGTGARRQIMKKSVPPFYLQQVCKKKLLALTSEGDDQGKGTDASCDNPYTAECGSCQPSCDDPDYKYCVLPTVGGQKSWNTAKIYRPAWETSGSRAGLPMTNAWWDKQAKSPEKPVSHDEVKNFTDGVYMQALTHKKNSDFFASQVNQGKDPPWFWFMGGYKGPGTGAITKLTFKGAHWGESNTIADKDKTRCFSSLLRGQGDGGTACNEPVFDVPLIDPGHCGIDPDAEGDCDLIDHPCEVASFIYPACFSFTAGDCRACLRKKLGY